MSYIWAGFALNVTKSKACRELFTSSSDEDTVEQIVILEMTNAN
jgi:hypothetical protein